MMKSKPIVLIFAIVACHAFPETPTGPPTRNTIFADEKSFERFVQDVLNSDIETRGVDAVAYRLPATTEPLHYNIFWTIDIARLTYNGTVDIQLYATEDNVTILFLHSYHNTLLKVVLKEGNKEIPTTYKLDNEYQFLIIDLMNSTMTYNSVVPVIYTLSISFEAKLRDDMFGIYKSWFRNNPNEAPRYIATTQFEPTYARYAFPCYDEPGLKATFDITIRRPSTHRSWSCTKIRESRTVVTNFTDDVYYTTPVMSTYSLALIVAEYESVGNGAPNRSYEVIARPGAINSGQGQYAFETGQKILATMSNYTEMDFYDVYPYIKMTLASIPDFSFTAMENWGLVTYRENYLMYDPNHCDGEIKNYITSTIAHEISHMWFGNLVTCKWWDVLWLNEGFASYYGYFLAHWVVNNMGFHTRFITEQLQPSLRYDSFKRHKSLTNPDIGSPRSIRKLFSTITYKKGASIIRMTEHLLGSEVLRQGLVKYLSLRRLNVSQPIHLFEALHNVSIVSGAIAVYGSQFNIFDYFKSWTEQPGHPVLNVHVDHSSGQMYIHQRRFDINTGYSYTETNYIVPITFATASNPNFENTKPSHILSTNVTVIDRGSIGDEWVVFNKQQTGFYRVNYDDYTWHLIVVALRQKLSTIHEYNRAQIVDDVFQFARSGLMSYNRAFNILSFLENETAYAPWIAAKAGFTWIRERLFGTTQLASLDKLITTWATKVMNELTYTSIPKETFMRSYLRYQLAPFMCLMNVRACRTAATEQFAAFRNRGVEVPVDNRKWVYCNALREGTVEDFNILYQRFLTHNVNRERDTILYALGCTPHEESLNVLLNAIVPENYLIQDTEFLRAWEMLSNNDVHKVIVLQYIQNNIEAVKKRFKFISIPIFYALSVLNNEADVAMFHDWIVSNEKLFGNELAVIKSADEYVNKTMKRIDEIRPDLSSILASVDVSLDLESSTTSFTSTETVSQA